MLDRMACTLFLDATVSYVFPQMSMLLSNKILFT